MSQVQAVAKQPRRTPALQRPARPTPLPPGARVLLSTPLGPYQPYYYDTSLTDVWNQRFSRGCDVFTVTGHIHTHFAHAICQNVAAPSVFLEYPREEDFLAELERGYQVVGLSGFQHQVDEIIAMAKLVRERSPQSTIVIGAWAAMGIHAVYPEETWRQWADYLCLSEGIRFMRELLGEDPNGPTSITHFPKGSYSFTWLDDHLPGNVGAMVASIGCTRGCDFCGPTALLKRKRVELMSPRQVAGELDRLWREHPDMLTATVYEEDSFADKDYFMEVGRLIREETEAGLSRINLMVLGGVAALEQWTLDEVALCGISQVFIGVESKFAGDAGYAKRKGREIRSLFRELHRRGISTIAGWVAGFDFQDRLTLEEDLQHFISLEPTMQQLTRLCAFPGTPLWRRLREEDRVPAEPDWSTVSFFGGGGMRPLHLEEHELMEVVDRGYRQLYETWGACFARQFAVNMNGYEYCAAHDDPYLRHDRSRLHKHQAARAYPFIYAMEVYAPNGSVRRRMAQMRQRYRALFGAPTALQRTLEQVYLRRVAREKRDPSARYHPRPKSEPFKRYDYTRPATPGECPYVATHPHLDLRYELHRRSQRLAARGLGLFGRALNGLERTLVRDLDRDVAECLPVFD